MLCPLRFSHYEFEGGQECIGIECGMHNLCNADDEITAVEFDALDEHAQALERENEGLRAKVDELTEQLETAHAKNRSLRQHIAKMQEGRHGWHVKGAELQKQVDEKERECKCLMDNLGTIAGELNARIAELEAERDELRDERDELAYDLEVARHARDAAAREREHYRKQLGVAKDHAGAVGRLS